MLADTTILIPTFNRPTGLKRLLSHLVDSGLNGTVVQVLDSSSVENVKENAAIIKHSSSALKLACRLFPQTIHPWQKCSLGVQGVETEFVILCPDVDFPILSTIQQCEKFLVGNRDYVGCHGFCVTFLRFSSEFSLNEDSFNAGRSESTAEERVWNQFKNYGHLTYSLRRTKAAKVSMSQAWELIESLPSLSEGGGGLDEMAESMFFLMEGKVKRLPRIQFLRNGMLTPKGKFASDFLFSPQFSAFVTSFNPLFSKALSKATGRSIKDCGELFGAGFAGFFAEMLSSTLQSTADLSGTLVSSGVSKPSDKPEPLSKKLPADVDKEITTITSLISEFPLPIDFAPAP